MLETRLFIRSASNSLSIQLNSRPNHLPTIVCINTTRVALISSQPNWQAGKPKKLTLFVMAFGLSSAMVKPYYHVEVKTNKSTSLNNS